MSMGRQFMIRLVGSVKKHSCLWDPSCEYYSRRSVMEQAWKDVSEEVGRSSKLRRSLITNHKLTKPICVILHEIVCFRNHL